MQYYANKIDSLRDIFGTEDVILRDDEVVVAGRAYPILDDVIILLEPEYWPESVRGRLGSSGGAQDGSMPFAEEIQYSFGEEWTGFPEILPEHRAEFDEYFDIVDLSELEGKRVCDLGCGIGRWAHFIAGRCREIVTVDFSDAIFVTRRNLADHGNALFFMGDLQRLPFRHDFCDFLYCIGVLLTLPTDCLEEVRALRPYAPKLLIYTYYALDNRPPLYRAAFHVADVLRRLVSRIRSPAFRAVFTPLATVFIYYPLIGLGNVLHPFGLSGNIPLWETHHGQSFKRISQDVYDRFFTAIEQRVTRKQVAALADTFTRVIIGDRVPYWHFLCER